MTTTTPHADPPSGPHDAGEPAAPGAGEPAAGQGGHGPGPDAHDDAQRVLIVDDHRALTDALALALRGEHDLECVAVAHGVPDALAKARAYRPDVVLLDVRLPGHDGVDHVADLAAAAGGARVVVLTAATQAHTAQRALAAGAAAYLTKDAPLDEILDALRHARPERPTTTVRPAAGAPRLTPRQHEVLAQLAAGRSVAQIAGRLGLSAHTVRDHVKALREQLGVHSQVDAVVTAARAGLVEIAEP